MNTDEIAEELLLRDTFEVTLMVDVRSARTVDDETLSRVLGRAAVEAVREHIEEEGLDP